MTNHTDKIALYEMILEYKESKERAAAENKTPRRMSNALGEVLLGMCNEMAKRRNFSGYPFIDEMVEDGIEDCVKAVETFDPKKSDNAFGYLSITIYYAFLRRIEKEKRNLYAKYKHAESLIPMVDANSSEKGEAAPLSDVLDNEFMINLVKSMDAKKEPGYVKPVNPSVWKRRKT